MGKYKLATKKPSLFALIFLISFPSVGAVLFTPGIPDIIDYFQISKERAQLTITLFLFGYAFAQLFFGPFANRFGRKKTIYFGVLIGIFSSVFAGLAGVFSSYSLLITMRFFEGLGSGVGLVMVYTIINDFYYIEEARKVIPYVSLSFAVFPFLGLFVGGYIVTYLNWESTFYFLMLYGIFVFCWALILPETACHLDEKALTPKNIWKRYKAGFTTFRLIAYSIMFGMTTAMIYVFAASAPVIVIKTLGISPDIYGTFGLIVSAAYVIGNLGAKALSKHLSAREVILIGMIVLALSIFAEMGLFYSGLINLWTLYVPIFFLYVGIPLCFANTSLLATAHFHDRPTASSIMNFLNMTSAVCGVFIMSAFSLPFVMTMPAVLLAFLFVLFLLFLLTRKYQ